MDANERWVLMKCSNCCGLARAIRVRAEKSRNPAKITNSRFAQLQILVVIGA